MSGLFISPITYCPSPWTRIPHLGGSAIQLRNHKERKCCWRRWVNKLLRSSVSCLLVRCLRDLYAAWVRVLLKPTPSLRRGQLSPFQSGKSGRDLHDVRLLDGRSEAYSGYCDTNTRWPLMAASGPSNRLSFRAPDLPFAGFSANDRSPSDSAEKVAFCVRPMHLAPAGT